MGQYDGASRYTNRLTDKEEIYCDLIINKELSSNEAFLKTYYPNGENINPVTLASKVQKMNNKPKIIKRIEELQQLKQVKNQSRDEYFNLLKSDPKQFVLVELYKLIQSCKLSDDRPNLIKSIDSIAKMFNLYNDTQNSNTFNTQFNQVIIKSKDLNEAITNIKSLVNKQS